MLCAAVLLFFSFCPERMKIGPTAGGGGCTQFFFFRLASCHTGVLRIFVPLKTKQVAVFNAGASMGFFRGDPLLLVEDMQVIKKLFH